MPTDSKSKIIIIVVIIILILFAIAGLLVKGSLKPISMPSLTEWKTYLGFYSPETPKPPAPAPAPAPSGQIEWQTYTNQKYGYSFKYPKNWYLDMASADKDFVDNIGGEVILANKENLPALMESGNPPSDLITLIFSIYQTSSQTTVDQFIKEKKYMPALSQSSVSYAKLPGKQLVYVMPGSNKEVLNIVTILKQNTKMFVFSYSSFKPDKLKLPGEVETIHDEILKSFEIK